jgi:polysaccharide biosynthesis transport protein
MNPSRPENFPVEQDSRVASASSGSAAPDNTLSDALMTIRKRKYVILAFVLLGLIFGFYKGVTQPRLYDAYGNIEIRSGSANQYRVAGGLEAADGNRLFTEVAILKSDTLLLTVARDLDLPNNQDFLGMQQRPPHMNIDDPNIRQGTINHLQGIITVSNVPRTDLIHITCSTFNAKLSADIVNKLIDEYVRRSFDSRVLSTQRASGWLSNQLTNLKHQVGESQDRLIDLQKRIGVLSIDPTHNQISSSLEALTTAADTAKIARILAQSRYQVLTGMDRDALDQTVANANNAAASSLSALRAQRETAAATYAQLTAKLNLGPENPKVTAVRAQIADLDRAIRQEQARVIAQAKETFISAQTNEEQTNKALEDQKQEAYKLRDDLVQYTLVQREFESSRTLYEGLLEKLQTASVQAGLDATEIDTVDEAVPPAQPTLKSRSSILMIDTLVALVIGIIVAFILESLDTSLHSVAEIEAVSGLHSLALIPRARRTGIDTSNLSIIQRNLTTLSSPKSQFTESFRALRTSLLLSSAGKPPKVMLLTSATPSEGKTTISTNLACVFAQRDVRVLLIDADLRRPTVHHRLGLNGKIGLTSVLSGSHTLEQAIQRVPEIPTLDILVSGPVPPFPTEMLSSDTMAELVEKCRGIYTHILIDSPPLLSVTDGIILARDSDAVVLVVRHGKSNKHTIRRARDLLLRAGIHITGVALNAIDLNSPEYYGYYGYSGYSGYGYGSSGVDAAGWESQSGKPAGKGQK